MASIYLSLSLIKSFSGKGLVPDNIAASPDFLLSVALCAGITVILDSLIGLLVVSLIAHIVYGIFLGLLAEKYTKQRVDWSTQPGRDNKKKLEGGEYLE